MRDQSKNILIGIFSLAAFAIIIFVLLFLNPTTGDEGQVIKVRFGNIDKVNVGTRVNYGGRPVGEVTAITQLNGPNGERFIKNGHIYIWELTLKLDSHVAIKPTDIIELRTSGLLGEKSVAITPVPTKAELNLSEIPTKNSAEKRSPASRSEDSKETADNGQQVDDTSPVFSADSTEKNEGEPSVEGQDAPLREKNPSEPGVVYANESSGLEETLKDFQTSARKLDRVLDSVYAIVNELNQRQLSNKVMNSLDNLDDISSALNDPEKLRDTLNGVHASMDMLKEGLEELKAKDSWNNIADTTDNLRQITSSLNKPEELTETLDNIHEISSRIQKSWDSVDQAIHNFASAATSLDHFSLTSNTFVENVSRGEGTVGHLFVKDDFYLHLSSILSKAETVMDDINHYGLLFHLDKGWQKLRARRANLLQKLSTPQQFRNFFNDEIDQITTSLSRVYMVLQKIEDYCGPCYPLGCDGEFAKVFAELLRRTKELEDNLQMYNEQATECIVEKTELVRCPGKP